VSSANEVAVALADRYEVLEQIAAGGFANVFKGRQVATGQPVAIKALRIARGEGAPEPEEQIARFRRETRLCAELQHPNIVQLLDSAETADGRVCAVFSYVPGWNLDDVLAAEGALDAAETLHLMTEVIDAISSAHARGIIHRDLKPANIMITATGARRNALVLDFGLGTLASDAMLGGHRSITLTGAYLGTPFYSAPEQLRGEPPTPRADLYSWGLVVLECLTGEPPFGARTPQEAIHRHLGPDPVPIPAVLASDELGRLLRRVTEKNVDARRISAAEALETIQRCNRVALPDRVALQASATRSTPHPAESSSARRGSRELSPIFLVPLARNPNFTGREDLLASVDELLAANRLLAVVALEGMGGIGKTQTALEYAYRNADRYRMVAWIRAERPETLAADYCAIGAPLQLPETPEQQHRIDGVRTWLERNQGWLLIFDNARDPAALRTFLPRTHAGHVLVTSRHTSWRGLASSLEVGVFEPGDATAFLFARTGDDDRVAASALWQELGGLPLALEDAAAYMESTGRSIASYLEHLRGHRRRLLFGPALPGAGSGGLGAAWELSFRQVEREAPRAAEVLALTAFLAPDDVPLDLFRAGAGPLPAALAADVRDPLAFDAAIAALRRYSLVRVEGDHLSIHRLIQLAARERLPDAERERWIAHALRMVEAAYPRAAMAGAYEPASGRLLPHALSVLGHARGQAECNGVSARLLRRTGIYRSARGDHDQAARDLEMALSLFEQAAEPRGEQLAGALWELAMVLYVLGEAEAARTRLERCVSLIEAAEGPTALRLAAPLITGSWVQRTLGEPGASLATAERALAITEAALGAEHVFNAMSLAMIARGLWHANRLGAARSAAERALALISGRDVHPMMSGSLYHLGQVLLELGDPRRARACAELGLEISERAYGPNHPFVSANSAILGAALAQLGELERARGFLERAWTAGQRICAHPHEDFAIARSDFALLLLRSGELSAAREALEHGLAGAAQVCGDATRTEIAAHRAFGEFHLAVGDLAEARWHARETVAAVEKYYGGEHPACLRGLGLLARILACAGESEAALERLCEARRIAEASEVGAHPAHAEILEWLGALLSERGETDAARELFSEACAMLVASLGGENETARGLRGRLEALPR
jgi:serine/threonine protein kinase/tetratricopeptide (TPR) repeat protein